MLKGSFPLLVLAGCLLLDASAPAQETNLYPVLPATKLELLEAQTGTLIIKGISLVGEVAADGGNVSVTSKMDTDTTTGRKEFGVRIRIATKGLPDERVVVDQDELVPLLKAIDDIGRIGWAATPLGTFDAVFTTRGGFRVAAFGVKHTGTIEFSLATHPLARRMRLSATQLAQLRELLDQARRSLETLAGQ